MSKLTFLAALVTTSLASADVMKGPFSVLDPPEWPDTEIEIHYDAASLDLISGTVRWHFSSNQGTDGLDHDPVGWLDPITGGFDVTLDLVNTDNGSPRVVRITPTTFTLDDSFSRDFVFLDLGFYQTGDSNLDGSFNSSDLVAVMTVGHYERQYLPEHHVVFPGADFDTGDWNGDNEFNSADFVMAMQEGQYEAGPPVVVTEPTALVLLAIGGLMAGVRSRRRWCVTLPRATARQQPPLMPLALIPLNIAGSPKNCLTQVSGHQHHPCQVVYS